MNDAERYTVRKRGLTLRWDHGNFYWAIDSQSPILVTLEVAEGLADQYGGHVMEVDA
jgi:hypothetical protein